MGLGFRGFGGLGCEIITCQPQVLLFHRVAVAEGFQEQAGLEMQVLWVAGRGSGLVLDFLGPEP